MTRVEALMLNAGPHRREGSKDKAQAGLAINELTPDWAMVRAARFTPGYRTVGRAFVSVGSEIQLLPGGSFFKWALECLNTPEPATEARVRGIGCAGKGSHIIPSAWAPRQGARCEYAQHRETNSDSFLAG
jgi:hypothetical protein